MKRVLTLTYLCVALLFINACFTQSNCYTTKDCGLTLNFCVNNTCGAKSCTTDIDCPFQPYPNTNPCYYSKCESNQCITVKCGDNTGVSCNLNENQGCQVNRTRECSSNDVCMTRSNDHFCVGNQCVRVNCTPIGVSNSALCEAYPLVPDLCLPGRCSTSNGFCEYEPCRIFGEGLVCVNHSYGCNFNSACTTNNDCMVSGQTVQELFCVSGQCRTINCAGDAAKCAGFPISNNLCQEGRCDSPDDICRYELCPGEQKCFNQTFGCVPFNSCRSNIDCLDLAENSDGSLFCIEGICKEIACNANTASICPPLPFESDKCLMSQCSTSSGKCKYSTCPSTPADTFRCVNSTVGCVITDACQSNATCIDKDSLYCVNNKCDEVQCGLNNNNCALHPYENNLCIESFCNDTSHRCNYDVCNSFARQCIDPTKPCESSRLCFTQSDCLVEGAMFNDFYCIEGFCQRINCHNNPGICQNSPLPCTIGFCLNDRVPPYSFCAFTDCSNAGGACERNNVECGVVGEPQSPTTDTQTSAWIVPIVIILIVIVTILLVFIINACRKQSKTKRQYTV